MFNPVSTYRIQFHKDFTFAHFERLIPYFERLGVATIYASPIFKSVPGSTHGYDGLDPLTINPEIGTLTQLKRISQKLKSKNISWIQDIVPNHMAYHPDNTWLIDVLENGSNSVYKNHFDTGLSDHKLFSDEKIMVPFLGDELDAIIERGELKVEQAGKKYVFNYFGSKWPLAPESYPKADLEKINNDSSALKTIAQKQHYRLCSWQETNNQINFRRFFTVNGLICLNIQNEEVFNHFHQFIKQLVDEEIFQGLRIDHIDGLYDPEGYLERLRQLVGDETYIIVEKILEQGEQMPHWPIQGNTGYDFLAIVNNLLTNRAGEKEFNNFYKPIAQNKASVERQIWQKKAYILYNQMNGELDNLTRYAAADHDIPLATLQKLIAEFLIHCPVYRHYGNRLPLSGDERQSVETILDNIADAKPDLKEAVHLLKKEWLADYETALPFYQRCMQFTGPLMAKGVEDTLMYTYNRFIGHNEVGDAPGAFGISVADFHSQMEQRQLNWQLSMSGTATHDTKRGEDARARLNVLTDITAEWLKKVKEWQSINKPLILYNAPDGNDEYFIYETLTATYPMPGQPEDDYPQRLEQYLEKTMREAKQHSDWAHPDEEYENAVKQFARSLLNKKGEFWKSFVQFHQLVCGFGVINSLTQVLLKLTAPGVPDVYQGCELWDLSMVDPDNRRPVDYSVRIKFLDQNVNIDQLLANRFNGQIKQWLLNTLLSERRVNPEVFLQGQYVPLQTTGLYKNHIIAFARRLEQSWYIVVAPLGMASIEMYGNQPDWEDTAIELPENLYGNFNNILTNTRGKLSGTLKIADLFAQLPLALLHIEVPVNKRSTGILMHITSLPSNFGIGDMGSQAKQFADMLSAAGQRYWQLLPLSPVDAASQFSPYSSWSAMGGNTLLISPDLLMEDGLLTDEDLKPCHTRSTDQVDFAAVVSAKSQLLNQAYIRFTSTGLSGLKQAFSQFCNTQSKWLDDFALYVAIKTKHNNEPWPAWPRKYRLRDTQALLEFAARNKEQVDEVKWQQFIFHRQWRQLKEYCNRRNILLFGDLPFYISHDSVDVWAHPDIFSLDKNGRIRFVAGVPPDYFNENGQLWGMPVFNWNVLRKQKYSWWVERMRRNIELFDLVRLDHFRAFSAYWAVPANEETAINGKWEPAPGTDLFKTLKQTLGKLPFVAEDLGDIDEAVYQLRDAFQLPGMKVLQFAFGDNMAVSPHIPHNYTENYIAYTGTHDNNTVRGWFRHEADKTARRNLSKYAGFKVNSANAAETLIKMALASVARLTIIPIQDMYNLSADARMNTPAKTEGNWQWRLTPGQFKKFPVKRLRKWVSRYNRAI